MDEGLDFPITLTSSSSVIGAISIMDTESGGGGLGIQSGVSKA